MGEFFTPFIMCHRLPPTLQPYRKRLEGGDDAMHVKTRGGGGRHSRHTDSSQWVEAGKRRGSVELTLPCRRRCRRRPQSCLGKVLAHDPR